MMPQVSFPARCAVAVICGEHLVSQVYPAAVPVEAFVDAVVELLNDDLRRRGGPGLDTSLAYELQRTNGSRLDVTKTLDELGVEDGATLIIAPASEGEPFEPQYEALSTGLARVGRRLFAPVTAETATQTALAILAMISMTIAGLGLSTRLGGNLWLPAAVTGLTGLAIFAGAVGVRRWWPDRMDLSTGLSWQAVPLLAVSASACAPGEPGAPHLFIGAVATATLVVACYRISRRWACPAAAVVTLAAVTATVAGVQMFLDAEPQRLGMGVLVGLLLLITLAPTIALWASRIRPPHFGSITGRDLFRRVEGMASDAVAPVEESDDDDPSPDTTPSGEAIANAARSANGVLTGICIATAVALPVAAWATVMPDQPRSWAAGLLVALFVLIFICRARAFGDKRQAVALVCGAAAAVCAAVTRYSVHGHGHDPAAFLAGATVLIVFAGAGLAAALLVPGTRFTPLIRMFTEWLELAAIVAALPLAAWVGGLFTWVRMR